MQNIFLAVVSLALGLGVADGQERVPRFAEHAAADSEVIVFVSDLMPHLQAVIRSSHMKWLLAETEIGQQTGMTPAAMNTALIAFSPYVPTEIGFATTDQSTAELAEIARLGLLWGLCSAAIEQEDEPSRKALDGFHKELESAVKRLKLQDIDVWLDFRNRAAVNSLFPQIVSLVEEFETPGIIVESSRNELTVNIKLSDLGDAELWSEYLIEIGFARGEDDTHLADVAAALEAFELQIVIKRVKSALHLAIGSAQEDKQPLDLSKRRLWKFDKSTLFYSSWRNEKFGRVLRETRELWEEWRDTAIGKTLAKYDEDDLLGDLISTARYFESSREGAMRVEARDGDLHVEMQEVAQQPAKHLGETGIVKLIPQKCDSVTVDTTRSLADHISDYLDQYENRLATRDMQYEMTGRTAQQKMTAQMTEFYYREFKSVRKMLKQDTFDVFASPNAVLLDTQGEGTLDVTLNYEGEPQHVQVMDMPMLEYAVISGMKDRKAAERFMPALWSEMMSAILGESTVIEAEDIDLGLGYTARGLNKDWQLQIPNGIRFNIGPDYRPHSLVITDTPQPFFVFSTSVPLTKRIIGQLKSDKPGLEVKGNQIASGVVTGDMVNRSLDMLLHPMTEPDAVVSDGDAAAAFMRGMGIAGQQMGVLRDVQELISRFTAFRWETTQDGNVQTTKARSVIEEPAL